MKSPHVVHPGAWPPASPSVHSHSPLADRTATTPTSPQRPRRPPKHRQATRRAMRPQRLGTIVDVAVGAGTFETLVAAVDCRRPGRDAVGRRSVHGVRADR